jgi:predicted PurR-regulated permease PerM
MNKMSKLHLWVFLIVFLLVILLNFWMFNSMLHSLVFASILAGSFYPLFEKVKIKLKLGHEWASFITCSIICLAIVLPLIFLTIQLSKETVTLYHSLKEGLNKDAVQAFLFGEGAVAMLFKKVSASLDINYSPESVYPLILSKIQSLSGKGFTWVNNWISDTFSFLFQFLIMLLATYGLFLEGDQLKKYFFKLSPLPDREEQMILDKFIQMNYVTLVCNGIGGLLQGVLAGIGMALAGIDSIFLWTTVMTILAFIPLVGISIITVPACLYLFLIGKTYTAIILFIYCGVISLIVENWFKPKFIGQRIQVNGLLLLFYILAGMGAFGMTGIFYGPLICIIFLTMGELFLDNYVPLFEQVKKLDQNTET